MDTREELVKRLGSGAAWRTARIAADPDDDNNRRSAEALAELAGHVTTLPADDRRLEAIAGLSLREGTFSENGDEVDELIARYGANRRLQSHPDTFLRALATIADRNAGSKRSSVKDATVGAE
jgi:hypothetical protein